MDPGMIGRPVTLATEYLLLPLHHCEKMLETAREQDGGLTDSGDTTRAAVSQSEGRQAQVSHKLESYTPCGNI